MLASDGSVISSNLPTPYNTYQSSDNRLFRCMVIGVNYVDSKPNITTNAPNPQITYEVVILGGFHEGETISNCRNATNKGGFYNYHESVLRKASKPLYTTPLKDQDGDIVLLQFLQGEPDCPQIIACGISPLDSTQTGATVANGPRIVDQYNGIYTNINKNGEYSLIRKGGNYNSVKDYFIPSDETEYSGTTIKQSYLKMRNNTTTNTENEISICGGDKLAIGANGIELLQKISDQLAQLITICTAEKAHTHAYGSLKGTYLAPDDVTLSSGVTAVPSTASTWSGAETVLTAIKNLIDSIKTTL